jgi:hypothetical protein
VVALDQVIQALRSYVLSAERIHADDTTVSIDHPGRVKWLRALLPGYDITISGTTGAVASHLQFSQIRGRQPYLFVRKILYVIRRRKSSVEEALIEMYLAGVSVRRVEDITEALWGTRVSSSTVSELNKKIYATIDAWRNRPIEGEHPYVYLDGIVLKRSWAGNVSLLVAIAVTSEGYREILGICEGAKEDKAGCSFLKHLKGRGLTGVRDYLRCLPRACRERRRVLPGRRMATVRGSLVPQHLQPHALDQGAGDRGDAQGNPRQRGHRGGPRKGDPSD